MTSTLLIVSSCLLWLLVITHTVLIIMLLHTQSTQLADSTAGRAMLYGPPEGTRAPSLPSGMQAITSSLAQRPTIVVFVAPKCEPCLRSRDALAAFAQLHPTMGLLLLCHGTAQDAADFAADLPATIQALGDSDGAIAQRWRVSLTPFAIALDTAGVVQAKRATVQHDDLEFLAAAVNSIATIH